MKTAGIICEYNPFHLGHLRQFRLLREQLGEDCAIICVMSGNYVQRGAPAMWDKFARAEAALRCGADLVLELPITAVLQSAEGFASAGVEILHRFGGVDHLCFGVEKGDGQTFLSLARQMETEAFRGRLRTALDSGISYAAARQQALKDDADLLDTPNNILALEYCRAILRAGSDLEPLAVIRNSNYHDIHAQKDEPSATAVRALFPDGSWQDCMPSKAAGVLKARPWYDLRFGERAVLARLRTLDDKQWEACAHGSEGLWRKAMKASRTQPDLESVITAIKSKRYPRTRIQRLLLCAYLGISAEDLRKPIPYVRILAASETGRSLLRKAKKLEALPLINAGETPTNQDYYTLECRASRLYSLFAAPGFEADSQIEECGRVILK